MELPTISIEIGEVFVDYGLCDEIDRAYEVGVFEDKGVEGENEDRHLSELNRRMVALDSKEVFVVTRAILENHKETVKRTIKFMEGEKRHEDTKHF